MACISGKDGVISVAGANVAQVRSWSITESTETVDCSSMGTVGNYRDFASTMRTWEGSVDVVWDRQDGTITVGGASVAFILYPEGTGDNLAGQIIINSMEVTAEYDGIVEASIGFTGTGALTRTFAP